MKAPGGLDLTPRINGSSTNLHLWRHFIFLFCLIWRKFEWFETSLLKNKSKGNVMLKHNEHQEQLFLRDCKYIPWTINLVAILQFTSNTKIFKFVLKSL